MSILKSLAKETAIYGLSYSLVRVLNFVLLTPFLAILFKGEKGFLAIHADVYLYIALGIAFLTWRMETAYFRFIKEETHQKTIFIHASQLVWISCFIFLILVYFLNEKINDILLFPNLKSHILVAAWIIVFDVICSLPFAKMRYEGKAKKYALLKVSSVILNLVFVFLLLYFLPKYDIKYEAVKSSGSSVLYAVLVANLAASFFSFIMLFNEWKSIFSLSNKWKGFSKILQYTIPLIVVTAAYTLNQFGSTSFLKYLLPGTAAENFLHSADFNAAFRLAVIMSIFVTAFNYAVEPFFFRYQKEADAKHKYAQISVYFTIACCIILLGTSLFSEFAALMFPKNYRGSMHLLTLLLLSNYFIGLSSNFSTWYKLTDRTWASAWISIFSLLLTFILSMILIPRYGVDASAWILLISNIFIAVASYIQGKKHYPIDYPLSRIILYLLIALTIVYFLPRIYDYLSFNVLMKSSINMLIIIFFGYSCFKYEETKWIAQYSNKF